MIVRVFGPKPILVDLVPPVSVESVVTGEVVGARIERRERGRGVVVQDERLARVLGEVDDHISALGVAEQQAVVLDVAHVEHGRVEVPRDGLVAG